MNIEQDLQEAAALSKEALILSELASCSRDQLTAQEVYLHQKQQNRLIERRIQKIVSIAKEKQQKIMDLEENSQIIEKDITFFREQNQLALQQVKKKKTRIDRVIMEKIVITKVCSIVVEEKEESQEKSLFGSKCKFVLVNLNYNQVSIEENDHQFSIRKVQEKRNMVKIINQHPMPSQGRYYFSFQCFSQKTPTFLAGFTTHGPNWRSNPSQTNYCYFNSSSLSFQSESKILLKCLANLRQHSQVILSIDCSKKLILLVIDNTMIGSIEIPFRMREEYLYFFLALSEKDQTIVFDHSDK